MDESLKKVVPEDSKKAYDMKKIILGVVDYGHFLEVQKDWAKNIVVGFARFNGMPAGIIANQPNWLAGSLDPEKVIQAFEGFQYKSAVGLWTMRKCDHQAILPMYGGVTVAGWNPFYNGSIRPDVKFPWEGPNIEMFSADKVALPATSDYNPRCP
jgi:hypothetical protein